MGKRNKGKLFSGHGKATGSRMMRRIIISASAIILLLIILAAAGYYQLLGYLQGNDFRQKVADTATTKLQADKVDILSNFNIDGSRISFAGIHLAHIRNIDQAHIGRISAEINRAALIGRKLHLRKLSLEDASVVITVGQKGAALAAGSSRTEKKHKTAEKSSAKSGGRAKQEYSINSDIFQLDMLECKDADVHYTINTRTYQLLGAQVTAEPAPKIGRNAWQINAENARFHTPFTFLRDSSIKSATIVYKGNNIDLTESRIMLTPGELRAKAHYDLSLNRWTADLQVNKGDIRRILNEDWKKRLTGEMYGRLVLTGDGGTIRTGTGNLSILNGVLEALPFLSQVPLGNSHPYRTLELEKADCQLLYPYHDDQVKNAWMFDKINLVAKGGMLIVHGHILVGEDGKLGGKLTIGLPERIIRALPVPREELADQLFTARGEEKGYMWVNMNLSGTIDKPQEDLSIRIATLVGRNLGKAATEIPVSAASGLLNTLFSSKARDAEEEESPATEEEEEEEEYRSHSASPINNAADAAGSLLRSLF